MSEATEIDTRVTRLENEMAQVGYLAKRADRDVSDLRATLNGHTGVLNAIGETLRDHGLQLASHGSRLDRLELKVNTGFIMLSAGQAEIKALLTRALNEPDDT